MPESMVQKCVSRRGVPHKTEESLFYFELPETKVSGTGNKIKFFNIEVRAQWQLDWTFGERCSVRAFPAPPLEDDEKFNIYEDSNPDFSLKDQLFWAKS